VKLTSHGLFLDIVAGAAVGTNIAVAGIRTTDELVAVAPTDRTDPGTVTIHAAGNIRTGSATNGKTLVVLFRRPSHYIGPALESAADGDLVKVFLAQGVK